MSDDIERRVRDDLRDVDLPPAPESLRAYRRSLAEVPRSSRRGGSRPWVLLVPAAAIMLLGVVAYIVGTQARVPPPTSLMPVVEGPTASTVVSPSSTTSVTSVDGIPVQSVGELLAARAAGKAPGGPYALRGYWTDRAFGHTCVPARDGNPGELELYCNDGEFGITERDEPILEVNAIGRTKVASGPHLTPYLDGLSGTSSPPPDVIALFTPREANGQPWSPVPIVVVGHFDDPRAADCRPEARQLCLDRFVIDRVVMFDPNSVPPPPSPTPFPIADPPPALFEDADCYPKAKKSFKGWATTDQLRTYVHLPGYVYAMVTRDPVVVVDWTDGGTKGHKQRLWARAVCLSLDRGDIEFQTVMGTQYWELDNGKIIKNP